MAFKKTTIGVAVYAENDSPIFGETATHVLLDESPGGGFFIKLLQHHDSLNPVEVILDLHELDLINEIAKEMINEAKQ